MKTSKAFSTISYNSEGFLVAKLQTLVDTRKIDFFAFVEHFPEEDEAKRHKHLYIVPNGKIDTDQVRTELLEVDISNPLAKPLGCMPCKSSKFADWYLYTLHDRIYLASKGQSRKFHYTKSDFIVSDGDYFNEEIHTIDHTKYNRLNELKRAVDGGYSFAEVLASGIVPVQQTYAYEKAYNILSRQSTYRDGRTGHEEPFVSVDKDTGEFLENGSEAENLPQGSSWIGDEEDPLPFLEEF